MLKTLGIVDACYGSQPDRMKACRRLGGKPVLEWVVRRATDCQQLSGVIVVTTQAPENGPLGRLVPQDVPVFVGRRPDRLGCLAAALEEYSPGAIVRIGSTCPFIDSTLIDRLVIAAETEPGQDYVTYRSRDGRPAILSPVDVYAEWISAVAIHKAAKAAKNPQDRESITRYFCSHPKRFRTRFLPAPERIDRDDVRLTADIEEDWEHTVTIFEALGPDELDWQRIAELLDHQPALRKRMAALNRAHART